jgi:hypothetical protein
VKRVSFVIVCLLLGLRIVSAQVPRQTDYKWSIYSAFQLEAHDKRLYGFSERKLLLEGQPEFWGTTSTGLSLNYNVLRRQQWHISAGLGMEYEKATFRRPFDHTHFGGPFHFDILLTTNQYEKLSVTSPVSVYVLARKRVSVYVSVDPHVLLYRRIDNTNTSLGGLPFSEGVFELDAITASVGLSWQLGRICLGAGIRVLNYQQVDEILFNPPVHYPEDGRKWEFVNPLCLGVGLAYQFGKT